MHLIGFIHFLQSCFLVLNQVSFKYSESRLLKSLYSGNLHEGDVVIPRKVDELGEHLSYNLEHRYEHFSRCKRDLGRDVVHYAIAIEGIEHHIKVEPHTSFIAPGLVVEHHGNNAHNLSAIKIQDCSQSQCHFAGTVRGHPGSRVVLSACNGLAGLIKLGQNEFIIEPAISSSMNCGEREHIIYKRSYPSGSTNCGTSGKSQETIEERLMLDRLAGNPIRYQPESRNKTKRQCPSAMMAEIMNEPKFETPPLYMEVMVTVDSSIYEIFKEKDLETYLFTIFNMVDSNFMDASLGKPINLKLVRIITLSYTYPQLNVSSLPPKKILKNFCKWQMDFNPKKESHPNHHDLAIFITRFDQGKNAVMGLTNMASMCRTDRSAAVVSQEGLLLANIITHQIGHSIGAEHDDGENGGCIAVEPDGTRYHMGPFITSSSAWSKCSRQRIQQFLMLNIGACLKDIPADHDFHFQDMLPGQIYSATEQCSLALRMDSLPCKIGDFCKNLFCQVSDYQCVSLGDPPAAGTPCAANMWCLHGECVARGQHPAGVNGGWGEWGEWTACTRSCGGGVQTSYRNCDSPPPSAGGRPCPGNWIRHRMCNVEPCSGVMQSFSDLQCKMTNDRIFRNRHWMWSSFQTPFQEATCSLICVNEKGMVAVRSPVMVDGTPCNPGTRDVCVEGTCKRVGCDWVIDSKAKEDACGVCHGDGTGCRIIHGQFVEPHISGLLPFLKLPVGTSMIFIREMNPSTCSLCITNSVNSTYFLRGNQELSGNIFVAGSKGVYDKKADLERILLKDPLKVPITVNVLCTSEENSGIIFQYALPERNTNYIPNYQWQYLSWDKCSDVCGGGTQTSRAVCVEDKAGEVEDRYCLETKRPADIVRPCNNFPCETKWWVGPWSNCECEDGKGYQVRNVLCMKSKDIDGKRALVVRDVECKGQMRPSVERPCNIENTIEQMESRMLGDRWKRSYTEFMRPYNPDEEDERSFLDGEDERSFLDDEDERRESIERNAVNIFGGDLNLDSEKCKSNDEIETVDEFTTKTYEEESRLTRIYNRIKAKMRKSTLKRRRLNENFSTKTRKKKLKTKEVSQKRFQKADEDSETTTNKPDEENDTSIEPFNENSTLDLEEEETVEGSSEVTTCNESTEINTEAMTDILPETTSELSIVTEVTTSMTTSADDPTLTTEITQTDNATFVSTTVTDSGAMFFEVWRPFGAPVTEVCQLRKVYRPTEQPPKVDIADPACFRLFIAPILPSQNMFSASDAAFQLLGSVAVIPVGTETKIADVVGPTVLKAIAEVGRQATKPPVIELLEND